MAHHIQVQAAGEYTQLLWLATPLISALRHSDHLEVGPFVYGARTAKGGLPGEVAMVATGAEAAAGADTHRRGIAAELAGTAE